MKLIFLLTVSSFAYTLSYAQTRIISGKVIDEFDLSSIPGVKIYIDTVQLTSTDMKGSFEIQIPPGKDALTLSFIGMETTSIRFPSDCKKLEIIMMADAIYDYMTISKINRKRAKRFKMLPNKHRIAYQKGVFTLPNPCFNYVFNVH